MKNQICMLITILGFIPSFGFSAWAQPRSQSNISYDSLDQDGTFTRIINPVYHDASGNEYPIANPQSSGKANAALCSMVLNHPESDFIAIGGSFDKTTNPLIAHYDDASKSFVIEPSTGVDWASEIYCVTRFALNPTYEDKVVKNGKTIQIYAPKIMDHGTIYPLVQSSAYVVDETVTGICLLYGYQQFISANATSGTTVTETSMSESIQFYVPPPGNLMGATPVTQIYPAGSSNMNTYLEVTCQNTIE